MAVTWEANADEVILEIILFNLMLGSLYVKT